MILDRHPELLSITAKGLISNTLQKAGRTGLNIDTVFRCLLLKQPLQVSFEQLAFHLSDSMIY